MTQMALADGGRVPLVVRIDHGSDGADRTEAATLTEPGITARQATEVAPRVLAAAQARDHAAFAMIVEHYDARLRALAWRVLRDDHSVNDALQDAYVKAYLRLGEFRGEAGLGTWLYRVVYTTCLDHLRAAGRRPRPVEPPIGAGDSRGLAGDRALPGAAQPGHADAVACRIDLEALLDELPPEQRAAVILVDAHGLGFAHTAEILGIPQGTVASRVAS